MAATKVGTRLRCERCGTEIIVVKATDDDLTCCEQPMVAREG
jgi:desulfoferrodoxin-like iron-binding protein